MFLTIQLCQASVAVSAPDQINNFISSTLFANIIGLSNIATVFILFFYGLSLYKKQAIMTAEIQLDEQERRKMILIARKTSYTSLLDNILPLIENFREKMVNKEYDEIVINEKICQDIFSPFYEKHNELFQQFFEEANPKLSTLIMEYTGGIIKEILKIYFQGISLWKIKDKSKQRDKLEIIQAEILALQMNINSLKIF